MRMRLDPQDDLLHTADADVNYNESRYYNFFDAPTGLGGWVRMGNRPNQGYAEMTRLPVPAGRARGLHVQAPAASTATRRMTPAACASR